METIKSETKSTPYLVCDRCKENNADDPEFFGCPRGSCDAEVKGTIITTVRIVDLIINRG